MSLDSTSIDYPLHLEVFSCTVSFSSRDVERSNPLVLRVRIHYTCFCTRQLHLFYIFVIYIDAIISLSFALSNLLLVLPIANSIGVFCFDNNRQNSAFYFITFSFVVVQLPGYKLLFLECLWTGLVLLTLCTKAKKRSNPLVLRWHIDTLVSALGNCIFFICL